MDEQMLFQAPPQESQATPEQTAPAQEPAPLQPESSHVSSTEPLINDPDVEANKMIAAVGYLGILCLIPLLLKKNSPFAQHHGKQGLVIVIAWLILFVANVIPFLGQLAWMVGSVLLLVLVVLGIVNSLNGKFWEMPFLGEYAKQIKL